MRGLVVRQRLGLSLSTEIGTFLWFSPLYFPLFSGNASCPVLLTLFHLASKSLGFLSAFEPP